MPRRHFGQFNPLTDTVKSYCGPTWRKPCGEHWEKLQILERRTQGMLSNSLQFACGSRTQLSRSVKSEKPNEPVGNAGG
jgi:hypothetical protein